MEDVHDSSDLFPDAAVIPTVIHHPSVRDSSHNSVAQASFSCNRAPLAQSWAKEVEEEDASFFYCAEDL